MENVAFSENNLFNEKYFTFWKTIKNEVLKLFSSGWVKIFYFGKMNGYGMISKSLILPIYQNHSAGINTLIFLNILRSKLIKVLLFPFLP